MASQRQDRPAGLGPSGLRERTLVVLVGIPAALALVWLGPGAVLAGLAVAAAVASWEAVGLVGPLLGERPRPETSVPAALLILLLAWLEPQAYPVYVLLVFLTALALLAAGRWLGSALLRRGATVLLAALYSAGLAAFLYLIRLAPDGQAWLLLVLLVTWVNDSLAYLVGSVLGRQRMAPRISPAKSWEGAAAGWAGSAAVGLLAGTSLGAGPALSLALLVALAGTLGDLLESWMKRRAGRKDSGSLLPGHGGVLDRLDSLLLSAPPAYLLLLALGAGPPG